MPSYAQLIVSLRSTLSTSKNNIIFLAWKLLRNVGKIETLLLNFTKVSQVADFL